MPGPPRTVMLRIRTARLELIAAPAGVTRNEAAGMAEWYAPLQVERPGAWPPPFNDAASQAWFARRLAREQADPGWLLSVPLIHGHDSAPGRRALIGNGGFTGPPDAHGSVEIGYPLLPSGRARGTGPSSRPHWWPGPSRTRGSTGCWR